jgi:hypothetical protein
MAARRMTAAQARDRKAKLTAIGLAVVLAIVAAIQGPTLLHALHKPSSAAPPIAAGVAAAPASTQLAAASVANATARTLTSFARFPLQDPFHAQVAVASATATTTTTTATPPQTVAKAARKPAAKPKQAPKPKAAPALAISSTPPVPFTSAPTPVVPPNAALITLNGKRQVVLVGAGFPAFQPLFKLVALGKKDARIGVFGGSFTSGVPTLALVRGRAITLADEADGLRYVLRLVELTNMAPPAAQTAPVAQTTTTTPSAPAPSVTTTTTPAGG